MSSARVKSISFARECNLVCVCSHHDISMVSLDTGLRVRDCWFHSSPTNHAVIIPETSTVAFTGADESTPLSDKSVCVYDWRQRRTILDIEGSERVCNILSVKKHIVIVYKSHVKVYQLSPVKLVAQLNGVTNDFSPCDCHEKDGKLLIAMTGKTLGTLSLVTLSAEREERTVNAASHALSMVKFSDDGRLIATCSEKGTIIRIFNTETASLVTELRRGTLPAHITSIAWSPSGQYLAVVSSNGTVHIFDINDAITEHARERATMTWKVEGCTYSHTCFITEHRIVVATQSKTELDYLKLDYLTSSVSLDRRTSLGQT